MNSRMTFPFQFNAHHPYVHVAVSSEEGPLKKTHGSKHSTSFVLHCSVFVLFSLMNPGLAPTFQQTKFRSSLLVVLKPYKHTRRKEMYRITTPSGTDSVKTCLIRTRARSRISHVAGRLGDHVMYPHDGQDGEG